MCLGVPWWHSTLRIWCCRYCGMGSIPGPVTSACLRHGQKTNQTKSPIPCPVLFPLYSTTFEHWWWNMCFSNLGHDACSGENESENILSKVLRIWAVPRNSLKYLQFTPSLSYIQHIYSRVCFDGTCSRILSYKSATHPEPLGNTWKYHM